MKLKTLKHNFNFSTVRKEGRRRRLLLADIIDHDFLVHFSA